MQRAHRERRVNMLILHKLAERPTDSQDVSEVLRYMIQSLSVEEISTINFLVSVWSFYLSRGHLTERQTERVFEILQDFINSAKIQFPENSQGTTKTENWSVN